MKTIVFQRTPGETVVMPLRIDLIADSALVLPDKPMFLPDFTNRWSATLHIAYRVSRLGKGITPKFAPRYYDAVTLALRLLPAQMLQMLHAGFQPTGIGGIFDNCVDLGRWMPIPDNSQPLVITAPDFSASLTAAEAGIDRTLSDVSQLTTLKIGDIIMPCHFPLAFTPSPGEDFTASLNSEQILSVRIR